MAQMLRDGGALLLRKTKTNYHQFNANSMQLTHATAALHQRLIPMNEQTHIYTTNCAFANGYDHWL